MTATTGSAGQRSDGPPLLGTILLCLFALILWLAVPCQLIYLVPPFERLFKDFSMRLPPSTEGLLAVSRWFANYWYVLVIVALPAAVVAGLVSWWVRHRLRSPVLTALWFALLLVPPLAISAWIELGVTLPLARLLEGLTQLEGARRRERPAFPATEDRGLLVQTGEIGGASDFDACEVHYPRPFAAPPELAINTFPEEEYKLLEQRKDGFKIAFNSLVPGAPKPSYRARGLPAAGRE